MLATIIPGRARAALFEAVGAALDDDLDTPLAVALLFEALATRERGRGRRRDRGPGTRRGRERALWGPGPRAAIGGRRVDDQSGPGGERVTRAEEKDWAEADRLRDELVDIGAGWSRTPPRAP